MIPVPALPLRSTLAALAWTWLATATVLVAAAAGRSEGAFGDLLLLVVSLGPLGWIAWSAQRPALEGALLGALSFAPLLSAAAYASDPARAAGGLYALAALLLLTWGTGRLPRRARIVIAAAFGLALPLGLWTWADLGQSRSAELAPLAPALSLREVLGSGAGALAWAALGLGLGLALAGEAWVRLRDRAGKAAAPLVRGTLLGGSLALAWALSLSPGHAEDRALLGGHLRPSEPAPVELEGPSQAPRAARSFGHRYLAGSRPGGARLVPLVLASHLEFEIFKSGTWARAAGTSPELSVVGRRKVLVGCFGEQAWRASPSLVPEATRVRLRLDQAPLLAEAGSAFDLVLVSPGLAPRLRGALRAWAASGGLVALPDPAALDALGAPEEIGEQIGEERELRLGSGAAIAPLSSGGWSQLQEVLGRRSDERHGRRARRAQLGEVLLLDPDPSPGGLGALGAGLLALALLWSALAALAPRLEAKTLVAGAWCVALVAGALLRALLPSGATWVSTRQVLEAPSGSRAAARIEHVSTLRLRPEATRLSLVDFAPPLPAFLSEAEAIQAAAELGLAETSQAASIALPAAAGVRGFRRLDACELPGEVRLSVNQGQIRVQNSLGAPLRDLVVLGPQGVLELGTVEPGATREAPWPEEPESLASWRSSAVLPATARWRRLVGAGLGGRTRWTLAAAVPGRPAVRSGAAGEEVRSALLLVTGPALRQ